MQRRLVLSNNQGFSFGGVDGGEGASIGGDVVRPDVGGICSGWPHLRTDRVGTGYERRSRRKLHDQSDRAAKVIPGATRGIANVCGRGGR